MKTLNAEELDGKVTELLWSIRTARLFGTPVDERLASVRADAFVQRYGAGLNSLLDGDELATVSSAEDTLVALQRRLQGSKWYLELMGSDIEVKPDVNGKGVTMKFFTEEATQRIEDDSSIVYTISVKDVTLFLESCGIKLTSDEHARFIKFLKAELAFDYEEGLIKRYAAWVQRES